ncbi:MAG: right-handed parallel beta-helix repeat-containing protein, partial [Sphingopyxis sp.]|nr:right-handed parallel beta-helix repeat-containing protein [Sphingopyxis sp.]
MSKRFARPRAFTALALMLALAMTLPAQSQPGGAPYVVTESGRGFARLQDAVNAIGDGTGTIRVA